MKILRKGFYRLKKEIRLTSKKANQLGYKRLANWYNGMNNFLNIRKFYKQLGKVKEPLIENPNQIKKLKIKKQIIPI